MLECDMPLAVPFAAALASMLVTGVGAAAEPVNGPAPLLGEPMQGPFATPDAVCKRCRDALTVARPAAPFLEARILVSGDPKRRPSRSNPNRHYIAARLPSGWWLREIGSDTTMCGVGEISVMVFEHRLETADLLPGGGAEILVETDQTTLDGERNAQVDDRRLHVCGVGTSGGPSCTLLHTYHFTGGAAESWDTPVTFRKDGVVVQRGQAGATDFERKHVVRFP